MVVGLACGFRLLVWFVGVVACLVGCCYFGLPCLAAVGWWVAFGGCGCGSCVVVEVVCYCAPWVVVPL